MAKRLKIQEILASGAEGRAEGPEHASRGTEVMAAKAPTESPAETCLIEEVINRDNLQTS